MPEPIYFSLIPPAHRYEIEVNAAKAHFDAIRLPGTDRGFQYDPDLHPYIMSLNWKWDQYYHKWQAWSPLHRNRVLLHRLVFNDPRYGDDEAVRVDHRYGDHMDIRLDSLRLCSAAENSRNRATNTPHHPGVTWDKQRQRWRATIEVLGHQKQARFDHYSDAVRWRISLEDIYYGEFGVNKRSKKEVAFVNAVHQRIVEAGLDVVEPVLFTGGDISEPVAEPPTACPPQEPPTACPPPPVVEEEPVLPVLDFEAIQNKLLKPIDGEIRFNWWLKINQMEPGWDRDSQFACLDTSIYSPLPSLGRRLIRKD
jgi:hypothetical protein